MIVFKSKFNDSSFSFQKNTVVRLKNTPNKHTPISAYHPPFCKNISLNMSIIGETIDKKQLQPFLTNSPIHLNIISVKVVYNCAADLFFNT